MTCNGVTCALPELAQFWRPRDGALLETAAERARILASAFPLRAVPDLCEMSLVANALDLAPDVAGFHAPPARILELADLFCEAGDGGLLAGPRRIDVFHHLRLAEEASFAGGVFIVVRCDNDETWDMLRGKGHVVSRNGRHAALYLPRHLLGVEVATSILDAAALGRSGYGDDYRPRQDLVAVARRDLPAGTVPGDGGPPSQHRRRRCRNPSGRSPRPRAGAPVLPRRRSKAAARCPCGQAIRLADVEIAPASALLEMRRRQDAMASRFDRPGRT